MVEIEGNLPVIVNDNEETSKENEKMKRFSILMLAVLVAVLALAAQCVAPTPERIVVTKEVEVEKEVVVTQEVEVIVEVTPTPEPPPEEEPNVLFKFSTGTFWQAAEDAWVKPYTEKTGIQVDHPEGHHLPAVLKAEFDSGNVTVDLFDANPWSALKLAQMGLIQPINWDWLDPEVLEQIPEEFRSGPIYSYGIPGHVACRVIAYRTDVWGDDPPENWADFWDQEKYPGDRVMWTGIYGDPEIEPALFALGYEAEDMASISVEMLDEAYAKLDEIKPNVVKWHTSGSGPADMLARGDVTMASTWDARVQAVIDDGAPIAFTRNQMRCVTGMLAIPTDAPHPYNAHKFLSYIVSAEGQADFQEVFAYGSVNPSSADLLTEERMAMLSTAYTQLAVFPQSDFYNSPVNPDDIFGINWANWFAENWVAFEAAPPGTWKPSENLGYEYAP